MLKVFYDSRTGNVQKFVNKLDPEKFQCVSVKDIKAEQTIEKGVLITYTTGFGAVPKDTLEFLKNHNSKILSVSVSGNLNWGDNFGKALDKIVEEYPSIAPGIKFELQGGSQDLINFLNLHNADTTSK